MGSGKRIAFATVTCTLGIALFAWLANFYWQFGTLPYVGSSPLPRIRWCDGGMTYMPSGTHTLSRLDLDAGAPGLHQVGVGPGGLPYLAVNPSPATANSGVSCPMALYLQTGTNEYVAYFRGGGP